jgi:hypothetical protein
VTRDILLVTGSRAWNNLPILKEELRQLALESSSITTILNGGAPGADKCSSRVALDLGLQLIERPADWKRLGRAAGILRNQAMLDEFLPRILTVCAFFLDDRENKGTNDMVRRARAADLSVLSVREPYPLSAEQLKAIGL